MFVVIWRYRVAMAHRDIFAAAYGPDGEWCRLFDRAKGYVGAEVLTRTNEPDSFMVINRWRSEADFLRFQEIYARQIESLDQKYAALDLDETFLGHYESDAVILIPG